MRHGGMNRLEVVRLKNTLKLNRAQNKKIIKKDTF